MGSVHRDERDAAIEDIAALDQPVRRAIYDLLVERDDWVGRDDAVEALDVPRSVAAFHLDKLVEAELAETRFERPPGRPGGPGAGRPAKKYRRSTREVAVSLPDRSYDLAGALLADAVAEATATGRPVEEALAAAAHATGRELGAAVRSELTTAGGRRRGAAAATAAALSALERLGYEPRVIGREVVLGNCPFHALAERHRPLVCGMNLELVRGVAEGLGAEDRLAPRLQYEPGRCCVRLRA
jgi:predicted ArsR family transcriptional regulator